MKFAAKEQWNPIEARRQLAAWIAHRFFVRFHVFLILVFTALLGVAANRLLFHGLDIGSPLVRYPLVVCASYLAFLCLIRLWLWYAGFDRHYRQGEWGIDGLVGGNETTATGHGGEFGGGGATGDWSSSGGLDQAPGPDFQAPDIPAIDVSDVGGDEGCLLAAFPLLALALLVALLTGIFYFLSYGGPLMLAEVALEGALAAGFWGSLRRIRNPGWVGGALQASWRYFVLILLLAFLLGGLMNHFYPGVSTLGQLF